MTGPAETLAADIRHFRCRVPRGTVSAKMKGNVRIEMYVSSAPHVHELGKLLHEEMERQGGVPTAGSAPRGALERDAARLLERLRKA